MPVSKLGSPGYQHRNERFANRIKKYFPSKNLNQLIASPMGAEQEFDRQANMGNILLFEPYTGSGAPSLSTVPNGGVAGDYYFRTGTPSTANQRIYICTVSGTSSAIGTFVGIV
ncbi:hypothetical protein SEA_CASSEROLE_18 [Arthrobacter phage Casserole]|nr:hypothetical protein SEA_CASSEROLE_18 [Arthrobacter phage Casserole]